MTQTDSFAEKYAVDAAMNPFYLRGDFDGDGKSDYAVWIKSKKNHFSGIAMWLSSQKKPVILGAGQSFVVSGSPSSDFNYLNVWKVYGKRPIERGVEADNPPKLIGEAIYLGKRESASGLIYWNGKKFVWYQQGD